MKRIVVPMFAALCLVAGQSAHADFTFPAFAGPFNVVAGTGVTLNVNDVANSAGVTAGLYGSFTVTADWAAGGGGPWSSEAEIQFNTSGGTTDVDPPTAGSASNGDATTLTFEGGTPGIYNPATDGFISIDLGQSFGGSDANWSNIVVTLNDFVPPPPPVTEATLVSSGNGDLDSYDDAAYGSGEVTWVELIYDGVADLTLDTFGSGGGVLDTEIGLYDEDGFLVGSNDDAPDSGDLLSEITFAGLDAGTYYVAASTFNTNFGTGFNVTTTGTAAGNLTINASTAAIPEPTSMVVIGLGALGLAYRRRR